MIYLIFVPICPNVVGITYHMLILHTGKFFLPIPAMWLTQIPVKGLAGPDGDRDLSRCILAGPTLHTKELHEPITLSNSHELTISIKLWS